MDMTLCWGQMKMYVTLFTAYSRIKRKKRYCVHSYVCIPSYKRFKYHFPTQIKLGMDVMFNVSKIMTSRTILYHKQLNGPLKLISVI